MGDKTALLIIDAQINLLRDVYQPEVVLEQVGTLLKQARGRGVPVIYVQHNEPPESGDLVTGTPGWRIHPAIEPLADEVVVQKTAPDAFYNTSLNDELQVRGIKRLVVTGAQTEYCVDATARRAVTQGYDVVLVSDAHSTMGNRVLTAEQIIAFYNEALNGFWAGEHVIRVRPGAEVVLAE